MSDDNKQVSADAQEQVSQEAPTVNLSEELHKLKDELEETKANLEKARRGESFNRNKRIELENQLKEIPVADEIKTKYEAALQELDSLKGSIRSKAVESALSDAAKAAGAKDVKALLKLVDSSKVEVNDGVADAKTVGDLIENAKKEYEVLFELPKTPSPKQPGSGNAKDAFKAEIAATKTIDELKKVYAKYGIGSTI